MNRFHFIIASLSLFFLLELSTKVAAANKDILKFLARIGSKLTKKNKMGQAVRMIQYDRAANERNAIPALKVSFPTILGACGGNHRGKGTRLSILFCGMWISDNLFSPNKTVGKS